MQLAFQKKILIIYIALFLFSGAGFVFLYKVTKDNIDTFLVSMEKWRTEEEKRDSAISLNKFIKKIEKEKSMIDSHFVQSPEIVPFLNKIEKLAKDAGAEAEVVSVNIDKDNSSLLVEIETQGTFENTYKFLTLLENSPYDLIFVSANIQSLDMSNNSTVKIPQWATKLSLKHLNLISQ